MARVKGGTVTRARRKKILKMASGYFGSKHLLFKTAKEQVLHSLNYAFNDGPTRKHTKRAPTSWPPSSSRISRISPTQSRAKPSSPPVRHSNPQSLWKKPDRSPYASSTPTTSVPVTARTTSRRSCSPRRKSPTMTTATS